ncbi:MAG: hypothetical protein JWO11_3907 [Nocardioides sp.]|nr:hypothetical protein [Nocardioides sp.]
MPPRGQPLDVLVESVVELGELGSAMSDADVDLLMERISPMFRQLLTAQGFPTRKVQAVVTKFRDAGRRTPPLEATSSIVPGRPQSGADGNRTDRWLVPTGHRYYANKRDAQLVEIRYYLQALSMLGAPAVPSTRAATAFIWLLGHELKPGEYKDPIMLRDIGFGAFVELPRRVQSGHYVPLARGGRHEPENTFLMLARSNSLQSDLTFDEFLALVDDILARQAAAGIFPDGRELPAHALLEEASGIVAE